MLAVGRPFQFVLVSLGISSMLATLILLCGGFRKDSFEPSALPKVQIFDPKAQSKNSAMDATTVTTTVYIEPTRISYDDQLLLVKETATPSCKENLRPDVNYITGWPQFGWNNQVIGMMNLLYLALIMERVPIIPPFEPFKNSHVDASASVNFSKLFDLPRLKQELGIPILEWWQVKDFEQSSVVDQLGCWSLERGAWHASWVTPQPTHLKLDISYSVAPSWIKRVRENYTDMHSTFWGLAKLGFDDTRPTNLTTIPSPVNQISLIPDDSFLCFDNLYFVCAHEGLEINERAVSPAWRFIGRYMHYTPRMREIADRYIRKTFNIEPSAPSPPYIAVHARRTNYNFANSCGEVDECLPPLSAFVRRVEDIKAELAVKGVEVKHVVMTSDESDSSWWGEVYRLGWTQLDHSGTAQDYGPWYPTFIDSVVLAGGVGLVGTDISTMSFLAKRRVIEWNGGVAKIVLWGHAGADDH